MIRRRVDHNESKNGHERWLVSYSDFVTLLFAFFVVMYSVSQVNQQKYELLSTTLSEAFEGRIAVDPVEALQLDSRPQVELENEHEIQQEEIQVIPPPVVLPSTDVLAEQLQKSLSQISASEDLAITATEDWVEIDVNSNLLFESGRAIPSAAAERIFRQIAAVLLNVPNRIEVGGHTDNRPIETNQFGSNWELSAARAASVVRLLALGGLTPGRLSAVGYSEFQPVASNSSEEGRSKNRRVVVKVARYSEEQLPEAPKRTYKLSNLAEDADDTLSSSPESASPQK